ncbi:MAG: DUF1330 domain-containing protein [Blastocatellia bacterium]
MTNSLKPTTEALAALAANPDNGPVVMLNLLKFKRGGGSKEYGQYSDAFQKLLLEHGGRFLFLGRATELLVGTEDWDAVALVEYPSRQVFLQLTSSPEYRAIAPLREQGLERTLLYATTPRAAAPVATSEVS